MLNGYALIYHAFFCWLSGDFMFLKIIAGTFMKISKSYSLMESE